MRVALHRAERTGMGISWSAIVWAGFVASILAASVFWLFRSLGWTEFSPTTQLGCLFFREPGLPLTETVGFALFLALGISLVPAAYAWVLDAFGEVSGWTGLVAGALHGALAAAALPLLARISRCAREGALASPGRLGLGWGWATPVAVLVGHMVYGGILGAVFAAFQRGGAPGP